PFWPMVKRAAGFVLRTGPRTKQDRWEENAGYTPFTLAVAIAGLLAAAEIAEACDVEELPALLRDTADAWNEQIEDWIYVKDTPLAREAGVAGYYIRVAPESPVMGRPDVHGMIQVRNHEAGGGAIAADELISTDAIALVRFGLRAPDVRACSARSRSSIACSRSNCPRAPAGAAITSTATVRRRTGVPSTESGSAASGRSWRANGRTTRLRRESARRRRRCSRRSRRRPVLAASSPSRCGTPRPFPKWGSRPENRPAQRCPSSGRMRNM